MSSKALMVVDMLNDFLHKEGKLFCGEAAREIIPFVAKKINEFHDQENPVIFVCDAHDKDDREFELFPRHAVKGEWGALVIGELPRVKADIILNKTRYSAFFGTNLDEILKNLGVEEVEMVGVCTSICVMDTVGELASRGIPTTVFKEGVADFDPEAHGFALKRMEKIYGAKVV